MVIIHSKSTIKRTRESHREYGWYIGPSLEHYCCVKCYVPPNNTIRDVDTLKIIPNQIPFPYVTPEYYPNQSATDILAVLQSTLSIVPSLEYGDRTKNELVKIAELFGRSTKKPTILLLVVTPTPTLPHISIPVKYQRVPVTQVFTPTIYQRSLAVHITTNYTSKGAEGSQYTHTIVIHSASSEQEYSKNRKKTKKSTSFNDSQ